MTAHEKQREEQRVALATVARCAHQMLSTLSIMREYDKCHGLGLDFWQLPTEQALTEFIAQCAHKHKATELA